LAIALLVVLGDAALFHAEDYGGIAAFVAGATGLLILASHQSRLGSLVGFTCLALLSLCSFRLLWHGSDLTV
ncbi:MAG: hypothetical protein AAFN70_19835, partial [Planctomycetota bacterium]